MRAKNQHSDPRKGRTELRPTLRPIFLGDFFGYRGGCVFLFRWRRTTDLAVAIEHSRSISSLIFKIITHNNLQRYSFASILGLFYLYSGSL